MLVPSSEKIIPNEKVPHKIYQVPLEPEYLDDYIRLEMEGSRMEGYTRLVEFQNALCEGVLNSTEMLKEVKNFDLLLYDSPAGMCGVLVSELLSIPRVQIQAHPNSPFGFDNMIPMPVSYVPGLFSGLTDEMTFMERIINLLSYLLIKTFWIDLVYSSAMNDHKIKYKIKPGKSYQEAIGDAELVLIAADFALEYAQPLLPGMCNNVYYTNKRTSK